MGGFGTMSYAARHPDLFVAAASFSGALNNVEPGFGPVAEALSVQDGGGRSSSGGSRTDEVRWRAHNPVDLAENLRPLELTVRTGNGLPGGEFGGGPDPVEMAVHRERRRSTRAAEIDKAHVWDDYGPGAHAWQYWARSRYRDAAIDHVRVRASSGAAGSGELQDRGTGLQDIRLEGLDLPPSPRVQRTA